MAFEMRHMGAAQIFFASLNGRIEINSFSNITALIKPEYFHFYRQPNFQAFTTMRSINRVSSILVITSPVTSPVNLSATGQGELSPSLMSPKMLEVLERIIYTSYSERKHFQLEQVTELLSLGEEINVSFIQEVHFSESDLESLHDVKKWLDHNLDKPYSLYTLVEQSGMNIRKLNRGFLNLFGKTPYDYLREQKLVIAHKKISETNIPIKLIAKQSGYSSNSNFSVAFKSYYGYPPASLRHKIKSVNQKK